jgi:5-methylcytosine-specific restriction endonuclease McrA
MTTCALDGCQKALRSDNRSGYCTPHGHFSPAAMAKHAERQAVRYAANREQINLDRRVKGRQMCALDGCTVTLRADNRSGYCAAHARLSPAARGRVAVWKKANLGRVLELNSRRRAVKCGLFLADATRSQTWARTGGQCHICLRPVPYESDWHQDHVVPLKSEGVHHPDNIAPAHAKCNLGKGFKPGSAIGWIEQMAWDVSTLFHLGEFRAA